MRLFLGFLLWLGFSLSVMAQQTPAPIRHAPPTAKPQTSSPQVLQDAPAKPLTKQEAAKLPVILFEKTVCFGSCPAYKASIYRNGRVTYEGTHHVNLLGQHELQLAPAVVTHILQEAKKIGFAQLPGVYTQHTTDLPATYLSIMQPDCNLKEVRVEEGAPESLNQLLEYIHQQIMQVAGVTK